MKTWLLCLLIAALSGVRAADIPVPLTPQEKLLNARIEKVRSLSDAEWKKEIGNLATQIRHLPLTQGKHWLIDGLSMRVTEGDPGTDALRTVADTLLDVARKIPASQRTSLYERAASLIHYEHIGTASSDPDLLAAMSKLDGIDKARASADFTLADLNGRRWTLSDLRGKVVMVNFWATWCPPCRKEMPDIEQLHRRFSSKGLVILAISSEEAKTVQPFIASNRYSYPILLDPGETVYKKFELQGIPETFVYDREGRLAAQAIDRRTMGQFAAMLKRAGLE